jgi:hypothetical protein
MPSSTILSSTRPPYNAKGDLLAKRKEVALIHFGRNAEGLCPIPFRQYFEKWTNSEKPPPKPGCRSGDRSFQAGGSPPGRRSSGAYSNSLKPFESFFKAQPNKKAAVWRPFCLAGALGLDSQRGDAKLRLMQLCSALRSAAVLTVPRTVIHFRRPFESFFKPNQTKKPPYGDLFVWQGR